MIAVWAQAGDTFLKGGDVFLSQGQCERVITVVGSCVALVLHCPAHGLSIMCHAMLPCPPDGLDRNDPKYVDASVGAMLEYLRRANIPLSQVQTKLFGGAVLPGPAARCADTGEVGKENVAMVRRLLEQHGIPLLTQDVGGRRSRHICLYPRTGEVRREFV